MGESYFQFFRTSVGRLEFVSQYELAAAETRDAMCQGSP
jgi:hypothetical protein